MQEFFHALHITISRASEKFGQAVSWLTLIMTLLMFTLVVLRYLLNFNMILLQEAVIYIHALVFLLGAGYTLKVDGHVRVDVFYREMSQRKQALVNLAGCLFLLLPMAIFIGVISWEYISFSWSVMEKSQDAGGLPFVYLLKSLILGMVASLVIQGISEISKSLSVLLSDDQTHDSDASSKGGKL